MSKEKEPEIHSRLSVDGLLISEQKELIDYLMEKQGFKRKPRTERKVHRAWGNIKVMKRDNGK